MVAVAAEHKVARARCDSPRFPASYPPLQFAANEVATPDGSLSLAYLAATLRDAGYEVKVLDCIADQPNGLRRVGMPTEAILRIVENYDVVGLSSTSTPQTTPCLDLIAQIHRHYPNKLILAGGVNARSMRKRFFAAGVDPIATSETEATVVRIAEMLRGRVPLSAVPGIVFLDQDGRERSNPVVHVVQNLDDLPMPAWTCCLCSSTRRYRDRTAAMANRNVEEGLDYPLFFAVVPFPGSALFEMAVRDGHMDRDFDPDELRWTKWIMRRLKVDPSTLSTCGS